VVSFCDSPPDSDRPPSYTLSHLPTASARSRTMVWDYFFSVYADYFFCSFLFCVGPNVFFFFFFLFFFFLSFFFVFFFFLFFSGTFLSVFCRVFYCLVCGFASVSDPTAPRSFSTPFSHQGALILLVQVEQFFHETAESPSPSSKFS